MKRIFQIYIFPIVVVFIVSIITGEVNITSTIIGGGIGVGIAALIMSLFKQNKSENLPEIDERVILRVKNFIIYVFCISIATLFIGVLIFEFLGYEKINLDYLYVFFLLILVVSIGGFSIIRKK